jgi:hypothetical protein
MVYDVRITPDEECSVNFNAYTGIYLIVPVEGGPTSMIFVTEKAGRVYAVSRDAGRFFLAANAEKWRAVFSSSLMQGTVHAMYQASGPLTGTLSYQVGTERRAARIPLNLTGIFMASDSEITVEVPDSMDIGVVGQAVMAGTFRADLTRIVQDQKDQSQPSAINAIAGLLERYGYQPDTEPLPPSEGEASASATDTSSPAPADPAGPTSDATLFPPGTKEEMERAQR